MDKTNQLNLSSRRRLRAILESPCQDLGHSFVMEACQTCKQWHVVYLMGHRLFSLLDCKHKDTYMRACVPKSDSLSCRESSDVSLDFAQGSHVLVPWTTSQSETLLAVTSMSRSPSVVCFRWGHSIVRENHRCLLNLLWTHFFQAAEQVD